MRVYLSGPITGNENYKTDFEQAEAVFKANAEKDVIIINPAHLSSVLPDGSHEEYMSICLKLLDMSDAINMLPGWRKSQGACIEYGYAVAKKKKIYGAGALV